MKKLLHLSYDFPDKIQPKKTFAVKRLVDALNLNYKENTKSYYVSLNRTTNKKNRNLYKNENGIEATVNGLPLGLNFRKLHKNAIKIVEDNIDNINDFDIVHAHKLTYEGVIANYIYKKYNIDYILTIMATDIKVLNVKISYRNLYKEILKNSKAVIICPWIREALKDIYGEKFINEISDKIYIIPYIIDDKIIFKDKSNGRVLTIFHFLRENIKRKNIEKTLIAIKKLKDRGENIYLDIIGDGPYRYKIEGLINKYKLQENVKLLGSISNNNIKDVIANYSAFVLCSYPETFGMVFIEALFAGVPIIYSKNCGVDGFFDNLEVGISVDHKSDNEIAEALLRIKDSKYKNTLKKAIENKRLDTFKSKSIVQNYYEIVKNI